MATQDDVRSEPQFTPGPWSLLGGKGPGQRFYTVAMCTERGPQRHVCEMSWDTLDEQGNADAHLIAAAPELYEAAEAISDHLERSLASFEADPADSDFQDGFHAALTTPEMVEFVTALRAALAKARAHLPTTEDDNG